MAPVATRPPCPRSSPRATCAADSRSSCGRSAKAASARARSTHSSWEPRSSRAEGPLATLKVLLLAGLIGYLGVAGIVWLAQERLLFYPRAVQGRPAAPPGWRIED